MNAPALPQQVLERLRSAGQTVAVAESITAGRLQALIASVPGASDVFVGGLTAYRASVKTGLLGVDKTLAAETNCVDERIAQQMALGALALFKSDYAIATCGYAERGDGTPYAFFAIAARQPDGQALVRKTARVAFNATRTEVQKEVARAALEALRALLANAIPPR